MIFNMKDKAKDLYYSNSKSGLNAGNAQDAIDEVSGKVDQIAGDQIPQEYLEAAVDEYVNNNSGGFATQTDLGQLSSEIANVYVDLADAKYNDNRSVNITVEDEKYYGRLYEANGWCASDMIDISGISSNVFISGLGGSFFYALYDEKYNTLISKPITDLVNGAYVINNLVDGAKYMRLSIPMERKATFSAKCILTNDNHFTDALKVYRTIEFNGFTKPISDLNQIYDNIIYRMQITNDLPNNLPSDYPTNGALHYLISTSFYVDMYPMDIKSAQYTQYILDTNLCMKWKRSTTNEGTWGEWSRVATLQEVSANISKQKIIECGIGKEYSALRSAIAKGCELGCKVVVYPGTYDLKEEFPNVQANHDAVGIPLSNGVHVQFMAGAYVKALFDNTDRWIYDNFQPFYSEGDFILEGLNIEASNTRYCVHDEHNGIGTQHHVYKNCVMKYTNNHSDINYIQCIGGGFGEYGYIEIDGGTYETVTDYGLSYDYANSAEKAQQPISYHNGISATCDCTVVIKNVYLKNNGYFRFSAYGNSPIKSKVTISNCSMGRATCTRPEGGSSAYDNIEIIEFNNEIRSNE